MSKIIESSFKVMDNQVYGGLIDLVASLARVGNQTLVLDVLV